MKTYNVELIFNNSQEKQIWIDFLKKERIVFNELSKIVYNLPNRTILKLIHDNCYKFARANFPELPSGFVAQTQQSLRSCYKSIHTNKHKIDEPVVKKNLSCRLDNNLYTKRRFNKKEIELTTPEKRKRIIAKLKLYPKIEELFNTCSIHDPLIFCKNDRLFLSVNFDIPEILPKNNNVLGIDLGMRRLFTTSDGLALSGKEYLRNKRRIRYNKRQLQKLKTRSAKKKLINTRKYEANYSKNYIHLITNEILKTDKSILVMEDLTGIKQNTSKTNEGNLRTKHNNKMGQIPFYKLREILTYKALHLGKRVETVNPAFTSQKDHRTGLLSGVRKGCRYYTNDKLVFDADWNAAINIAQRFSKHPIPTKTPIDGRLVFLGRLQTSANSSIAI